MLQRMPVRDGQSLEDARRVFDDQLGVSGWGTPTSAPHGVELRDPKTPWWWVDAEEASQSFLTSMGVNLV